jgi:hypothetical protein
MECRSAGWLVPVHVAMMEAGYSSRIESTDGRKVGTGLHLSR